MLVLIVLNTTPGMGNLRRFYLILFFVGIFLVPTSYPAIAQKQITEREQTWFGYFHQSRFTRKSGLWLDLHFRMTDHYVQHRTMTVARAGYIHYFSEVLRLTGGYAFANRYNQSGRDRIPEHRPWQQLQWTKQTGRFILVQGFRIEQRFRRSFSEERFNFNWRFRYNVALTIPLTQRLLQPSTLFLLMSNEVMVNAGKRIVYNYFDQNRSFAGLGYQFNRKTGAHLGYLFIFQQDDVANHYIHTHAIRLFFFHNLDFRNSKITEKGD